MSRSAIVRPNDCPPESASPQSGAFFRLVRPGRAVGSSTEDDDWRLPFNNRKGDCAGRSDLCECHALSVFASIADVRYAIQSTPGFRNKLVAEVIVSLTNGVLANTPLEMQPSHHDWWTGPDGWVPMGTIIDLEGPQ